MHKQLQLLRTLKEEFHRSKELADYLEERYKLLPKGSLLLKRGQYYRAVQNGGKREQLFISPQLPDQEQLIQELRERQYIKKALPVLKKNLAGYEQLLKVMHPYDPIEIQAKLPRQYEGMYLRSFFLDGDIWLENWQEESYEKNTGFAQNLIYRSEGGLMTRSKAEADIATMLERNELTFRYEPVLYLGKKKVSPDFCVVHPYSRKQIYWEHFGSMDNPDYADKTMDKLRRYAKYGYFLGDRLIVTWESRYNPLTFHHINDRIKRVFL